ncbi:hypothetical protein BJX99DRAFT_219477 [Aspergillus californicus]
MSTCAQPMRISTTAEWPCSAAQLKGGLKSKSTRLSSTLLWLIKRLTTDLWPFCAAQESGVRPVLSRELTSTSI